MAIYFIGEYPELYKYLASDVNLETNKNGEKVAKVLDGILI